MLIVGGDDQPGVPEPKSLGEGVDDLGGADPHGSVAKGDSAADSGFPAGPVCHILN
jgi:hypothetical protein